MVWFQCCDLTLDRPLQAWPPRQPPASTDPPPGPQLPLTPPHGPLTGFPAHTPDGLLVFLVLFALCYPDAALLGSRAT